MLDAKNMASSIIKKSNENNIRLDHLKLQKLLYFIALEWVKVFDQYPYKQKTEMWKLGPVINDVYSDYRNSGSLQITKPATTLQTLANGKIILDETLSCDLNEVQEKLVSDVILKFGKKDSFTLVDITHRHKPWKINEDDIINRRVKIKYTLDDFKSVIKENYTEVYN